ncbi:MAG: hypothetical protein ABJF23_32265 [Bryobacteraceae bacterium]
MTPTQYKARYENLKVRRMNGKIETVRLSRYRLNHWNVNTAELEAFRGQLANHGGIDADLSVFTNSGEVKIAGSLAKAEDRFAKAGVGVKVSIENQAGEKTAVSKHGLNWGGAYPFLGKGSPEHCQIVLQLAERWNLAKAGLQNYADSALGLDCNGFVGNYIWHGRRGSVWTSGGFTDPKGPDSRITSYFSGLAYVRRWEDINPVNTYLLGMVDKHNNIIPGGGGVASAGHIMVTEPSRRSAGHWDTYSPRLWVVESTAGALQPGLSESWYECLDYKQSTGVFTLSRGDTIKPEHKEIRCKIALLSVP